MYRKFSVPLNSISSIARLFLIFMLFEEKKKRKKNEEGGREKEEGKRGLAKFHFAHIILFNKNK